LRSAAIGPPAAILSFKSVGRALSALGYYGFKLVFPFKLGLTIDASRVFRSSAVFAFGVILAGLIVVSCLILFKKNSALRFRDTRPRKGDDDGSTKGGDSILKKAGDSAIEKAGDTPEDEPINKTIKKKSWKDEVAAGGAAFSLLAVPALLVIVSRSAESFMAWRFMYLASGLAVLVIIRAAYRFIRREAAAVLLAVLAVLYAFELYPKVSLYAKEEAAIWLAVKNPSREDALARLNIGLTLLDKDEERGLAILRGLLDEKERPNAEALKVRVAEELAAHYTRLKETAKAAPYYDEILRSGVSPSPYFLLNYAVFLALTGRPAEGERIVTGILEIFPENHLVLLNAARFYAIVGNFEKAAEFLRKDYALFPSPQTRDELRALEILKK
jgi:tetratricopeptide (TPR) repeat protein